jgi:hypothetical protein
MRLFICICIAVFFTASAANAEFRLTYRDGTTVTWRNLTDSGDNYCTWLDQGTFCIPKRDIVSVQETKKAGRADDVLGESFQQDGGEQGQESNAGSRATFERARDRANIYAP